MVRSGNTCAVCRSEVSSCCKRATSASPGCTHTSLGSPWLLLRSLMGNSGRWVVCRVLRCTEHSTVSERADEGCGSLALPAASWECVLYHRRSTTMAALQCWACGAGFLFQNLPHKCERSGDSACFSHSPPCEASITASAMSAGAGAMGVLCTCLTLVSGLVAVVVGAAAILTRRVLLRLPPLQKVTGWRDELGRVDAAQLSPLLQDAVWELPPRALPDVTSPFTCNTAQLAAGGMGREQTSHLI